MRRPHTAATLTAAVLAALLASPALAASPTIHAHRGGTVTNGKPTSAEESLRAYKNAARDGFTLEVDAKLTEDGVPVAIHDATLDRTTNCSGEVRTFTLAELAGCRTDVPAKSARIITIQSLLEFAKRAGSEVNLEIKNVPTDPDYDTTPAYANRVMDAVIASGIPRKQLIVQSFIPANLDVALQRLPGVRTSLLALQSFNELFLQAAADRHYDLISPEWPVTADYVTRAHSMGLDVAPFTLNAAADVRAARKARVDALITDDPLMAGRALGLRPPRFFTATAFIDRSRLVATGDLLTPRGVTARQGCRGTITMRVMIGDRPTRTVRGRLNRNCEFFFGTHRTPPRLGPPLVTVRFDGNAKLLPRLVGPFIAQLKPPVFNP
ncbi:MAG: glycerophosphoryl diester phosphodiesterase [Thermoleophilaceae bacterium]|jgi:glycerophosphoryl diester phosphodiesterase|nr:glycerophosphoryl diester phosphodiesterase [Thermoleophilaceae bacterium]